MTAELSSINPNTSLRGVVLSPTPTGREPELLQDCDRKLSRALANTPGARLHAREAAAASAKPIPAGLKCPPDPLAMLETLRESERRWAANDYMNYDRPDATALIDEIERLQVAEGDLTELLEATTGVLLVLSLLAPEIEAMGCGAARAVEKFTNAVKEATNA